MCFSFLQTAMTLPYILRAVSVEPAVLFFTIGMSIALAIQPEFIYFKQCYEHRKSFNNESEAKVLQYCRVDILQPNSSQSFRNSVQTASDLFSEYLAIASSVSAIFAALVIGAYSDRHGRKLPLMLSLCGNVLQNAYIIFLSALPSVLPLWSLIVVFCLAGFTGGSIVTMAASFAIAADHSPEPSKRAVRVSIISGCIAAGFTIGSVVTIYTASNYTLCFMLSCGSFSAAFLYCAFVLTESMVPSQDAAFHDGHYLNEFLLKPVQDMWKTLVRQRPNGGRVLIGIAMASFALVFCADVGLSGLTLLFVKRSPLLWTDYMFNVFMTILTLTGMIGTVITAFAFRWWKNLKAAPVSIFGGLCCGLRLMMIAISTKTWMVYLISEMSSPLMANPRFFVSGCVFNTFAFTVYPGYRTLVSLLVEPNETGRIFAVIASIENGAPIISSLTFNNIYLVTEKHYPATVFWLSMGIQLFVCVVMSATFMTKFCRRNSDNDYGTTQLVDE